MKNLAAYGLLNDSHLRLVSDELARRGLMLWYFDPTRTEAAEIHASGRSMRLALNLVSRSGEVRRFEDPAEISIWIRNKAHKTLIHTERDQELHFRISERGSVMRGLIEAFEISHYSNIRNLAAHEDKIFQLRLAQALGFSIPDTIISNTKESLLALLDGAGPCIMKPLRMSWIPGSADGRLENHVMMTSEINRSEVLEEDDAAFNSAPAIYQAMISKACECRVVASRRESVFYRIDTSPGEISRVDWRRDYEGARFSLMDVDRSIEALTRRYLENAGLQYGVFDFIISSEGDWYFLECNSDGQWAWLGGGCARITSLMTDLALAQAGHG